MGLDTGYSPTIVLGVGVDTLHPNKLHALEVTVGDGTTANYKCSVVENGFTMQVVKPRRAARSILGTVSIVDVRTVRETWQRHSRRTFQFKINHSNRDRGTLVFVLVMTLHLRDITGCTLPGNCVDVQVCVLPVCRNSG